MTRTTFSAQLLLGLLMFGAVLAPLAAPTPAYAQAGCVGGAAGGATTAAVSTALAVPVSEAVLQTHASANTAIECEESVVMNILNGIAWAAAKAVVQAITQSLVQWINSGFEGSPAFETNLKAGLLRVADGVVTDFLFDLGKTDQISMPWGDALQEGIALGYYLYTSPQRLQAQLRYTLASFSSNPQAYLFGDFRYGGWNAWYQVNTQCGNNPYCSQLATHDELTRRLDSMVSQRLRELDWGRGFLSWRGPCQKYAGGTTTNEEGEAVPLSENEGGGRCLEYSVRTPGAVIESQLEHQLGSGIRQLELADSINEIIGALAAQLVSQVLSESGLLGTSQPSYGGGRSYLQQIVDNQVSTSTNPTLSSNLAAEVDYYTIQVTTYRTSWETLQTAAQAAKTELESCLSENNNNEVLAGQVEPVLTAATASLADADTALAELARISAALDSAQNISALPQLSDDYEAVQALVTIQEVANATAQAATGEGTTLTELQTIADTACD